DLGRAKALEQCGRAVADAGDLLVQCVAIQPAFGFRLHRADEAAELLGVRDDLLFERVDGFSRLLLRHCVSDPYGVSSPTEARAGIVPAHLRSPNEERATARQALRLREQLIDEPRDAAR